MNRPEDANTSNPQDVLLQLDPLFDHQVQRLHRLIVYGRWVVISLVWIGIAPFSLWALRDEFALWHDYFTWAAVRYGLAYNFLATLGLAFCIGMTVATLIWQSRNILWGLSKRDRQRLEQDVCRIRQQGPSHPLWKWISQ
jgi:hypothetical protein